MKCWKCGMNNQDGAASCLYCGNELDRLACTSDEGKAMRAVFDQYGAEKIFTKNTILINALGDYLQDSGNLRNQIRTVMDVGVGEAYLKQLKESGHPNKAFRERIWKMITEEAGFSDKIARDITGYFDEMIGWKEEKPAKKAPPAAANVPINENEVPQQKDVKGSGKQAGSPDKSPKGFFLSPVMKVIFAVLAVAAILGIAEFITRGPDNRGVISGLLAPQTAIPESTATATLMPSTPTPSPAPTQSPTPIPELIHDTGKTDYMFGFDVSVGSVRKQFDEIIKNAANWTKQTAPQELKDFPLLPNGIYKAFDLVNSTNTTLNGSKGTFNWVYDLRKSVPDWKPDGNGAIYFCSRGGNSAWSQGNMTSIGQDKYSFDLPQGVTTDELVSVGQYTWKNVGDSSGGLTNNLWIQYMVEKENITGLSGFNIGVNTDQYRVRWIPYDNGESHSLITDYRKYAIEIWQIDPNQNYEDTKLIRRLVYDNVTGELITCN